MIAVQKTWQNFGLRILLILLVLAVWEAAVRIFSIPSFILPPPSNTISRFSTDCTQNDAW